MHFRFNKKSVNALPVKQGSQLMKFQLNRRVS